MTHLRRQAGANINQLDWNGLSPLKLAIQKKDMAMVKLFLKHSEDPLHMPRHQIGAHLEFDQSIICLASSIGDASMIQRLLGCSVHPNTRNEHVFNSEQMRNSNLVADYLETN